MMWPSSQASKLLTLILLMLILYCILMDLLFLCRIQNYRIDTFDSCDPTDADADDMNESHLTTDSIKHTDFKTLIYENVTWVPCNINPLCHPTVKALLIDHVNHYIYGPLCAVLDGGVGLSKYMIVTPNIISVSHVIIAMVGGKLLTSTNLAIRRLGVVLFQVRMFLDDLDGYVARVRNNVIGEMSEVGTLGYWVDGVCDLLGVLAMMAGVFVFLIENPPRLGYKGTSSNSVPYHALKEINSASDVEKDETDIGILYKTKVSKKCICKVLMLYMLQMLISSLAWNRYIDLYQVMFRPFAKGLVLDRQETVFRSSAFFTATGIWRLANPHSYQHVLSFAIFCDKTWSYLKSVQYTGYVFLVICILCTEYMTWNISCYIFNSESYVKGFIGNL